MFLHYKSNLSSNLNARKKMKLNRTYLIFCLTLRNRKMLKKAAIMQPF